jgi:hypothetical protein
MNGIGRGYEANGTPHQQADSSGLIGCPIGFCDVIDEYQECAYSQC